MPELYFFLNVVPKTRFLLIFPWTERFYSKTIKENIYSYLQKNKNILIMEPYPPYSFPDLKEVKEYVYTHYKKKVERRFVLYKTQ